MPIRVALADDHEIVLNGLKRLFESDGDFRVVASCRDGKQALAEARARTCDVLVLDLRIPEFSGMDVLRALAHERSRCRVVLLTATIGDDDWIEAVRLGVHGIVLKEASPETLFDAVRRVHSGRLWLDPDTMSRALKAVARREAGASEATRMLTPRELEIVRMIVQGLRNKAIAERLAISEGTVKLHLHNVYEKLGVDGRLSLMVYAQQHGVA